MAVTMYIGGREISREEQNNYEVVIDGATRRFIGLQRKETLADESECGNNPILHGYA